MKHKYSKLHNLADLSAKDVDHIFKTFDEVFAGFMKEHHEPPRVSFYIFSRLMPLTNQSGAFLAYLAKPAGMWGALSLDQALEAATRQYPPGERVLLRLDFTLPDPPELPNLGFKP